MSGETFQIEEEHFFPSDYFKEFQDGELNVYRLVLEINKPVSLDFDKDVDVKYQELWPLEDNKYEWRDIDTIL